MSDAEPRTYKVSAAGYSQDYPQLTVSSTVMSQAGAEPGDKFEATVNGNGEIILRKQESDLLRRVKLAMHDDNEYDDDGDAILVYHPVGFTPVELDDMREAGLRISGVTPDGAIYVEDADGTGAGGVTHD